MQNLVETIRQAGPMPEFLAAIKSTQGEIDRIEAQIKEEPEDGMEMLTLADAVEEIEYLRSSLQNPGRRGSGGTGYARNVGENVAQWKNT